jgi:hypothetical protein
MHILPERSVRNMRKKLPVLLIALIILLQAFTPAVFAASKNEVQSQTAYLCPFDPTSEGAGSSINTPYGKAIQSNSKEALQLRQTVDNGGQLYRTGAFGKSNVTDAQFWAPKNPLSSGYANKYGLANSQIDYVIGVRKVSGAPYVTRPAPAVPPNSGGGIEIVTNPNSVRLNFFHMP